MAEKLNPFYKLLKTEVPINITSELKATFDSVNKALSVACEIALKQPIPGKQIVLRTDASFRSAGYALMIEDNPDQKIQSKRKTYAPVAFGSKIFSPPQLKMPIYSKELLAIYMAFPESAHILWETTKPTIVLTDNKSVTLFFQTKAIPPSLLNACDYVLQFNFKIAHIAGSVNTAADFLSRLEVKVTERIRLKIREDVQTTPIEVTTSSSDVADEEQFFFAHTDDRDETGEQIIQRKKQSREKAAEWVVNQEPSSMKPSIKEFTKIDGNTTAYSFHGIKANARIRVEEDADLVLKNLKLKILGQPHDDVLLTTERRIIHYKANENRIILKDGLLLRKYYGDAGSVKFYQILIPKQLVNEVLRSLHGDFGKHPGITKTIIAYREKYCYPKMAQLIKEWVMSCEKCIRELRINPQLTRPSGKISDILPHADEIDDGTDTDHYMQPDADNSVEQIDPTPTNPAAHNMIYATTQGQIAMTTTDIKSLVCLGMHPEQLRIQNVEFGKVLRNTSGARTRSPTELIITLLQQHRITSNAVLVIFQIAEFQTPRSRTTHLVYPSMPSMPDSETAQDILEQTGMIFQDVRRNAMQAYIKYKAYYDEKANASKFKQPDYVYILQPKADHQGSKFPFTDFRWIGSYFIEKVLPNNNYVVRKIGTNKTQILHRMKLRQFKPRQRKPDTPVTPREWQPDPEIIINHDDFYARAWECEYDEPIYDCDHDNLVSPNSPEVTLRSGEAADETKSTPGTIQEDSSDILPHADEIDNGTDTDHYMQPDADKSVEQINPTPPNSDGSRSLKFPKNVATDTIRSTYKLFLIF